MVASICLIHEINFTTSASILARCMILLFVLSNVLRTCWQTRVSVLLCYSAQAVSANRVCGMNGAITLAQGPGSGFLHQRTINGHQRTINGHQWPLHVGPRSVSCVTASRFLTTMSMHACANTECGYSLDLGSL